MWRRGRNLAVGALLLAGVPVLAAELRVVVARANVRAEPSTSSAAIASLERGALVEERGRKGEWYKVRIPSSGVEGYIHESLVQAVAKPAVAAPARPSPPETKPAAPSGGTRTAAPKPATPVPGTKPASAVPPDSSVAAEPKIGYRAFAQGGYGSFSASESFQAVFGSSSASSFGFGAEVRYGRFFLQVNRDSSNKTGERVFIVGSEAFPLGIEDRLKVTPLSVIVGYRFMRLGPVTLLGGAGLGSYAVKEEWDFADPSETVDESFTSYHALLGAEIALHRWVALRAEVQYATVPDSAGVGGVSEAFGENDIGGPSVRVKLLVGR